MIWFLRTKTRRLAERLLVYTQQKACGCIVTNIKHHNALVTSVFCSDKQFLRNEQIEDITSSWMSAMSASGDVTVKQLTLEDLSMAAALLQRSAAKCPGQAWDICSKWTGTFCSFKFRKSPEGSMFAQVSNWSNAGGSSFEEGLGERGCCQRGICRWTDLWPSDSRSWWWLGSLCHWCTSCSNTYRFRRRLEGHLLEEWLFGLSWSSCWRGQQK